MVNHHTVRIDPIYNGPPDSAHGGVAAGRMAELVDPRRARVRLQAPIPIDTPMTGTESDDGAVEVTADGQRIAAVRALDAPLGVEYFPLLDPKVVEQAEADFREHWGGGRHPFPTCFGCGPGRDDGRGMELRSGAAPGRDLHAAWWNPGADGPVPHWLVWAALDCPSGFPAFVDLAPDRARVTGEFAVEIRHPVAGDGVYQILSHVTGASGRKTTTAAAIVDEDGTNLAVATAIWIEIPLATGWER